MWEVTLNTLGDTLLDALLDTLRVFPFVFLIYVLIELIEHFTSFPGDQKRLQGNFAPLVASATGIIPQCGFSVMAAKLYDRGLIRTGTLLAVFLATSDEAIIILLSDGTKAAMIAPLIIIKICVAVFVGYGVNLLLPDNKKHTLSLTPPEEECVACGHYHGGNLAKTYLLSPLLHSLTVAVYLLLVNIILGILIAAIGSDTISSLIVGGPFVQPFITSLIGLIPNCASSVIITETYISGFMSFGSCIAGLCANAGLGFVILFRNTAKIRRNVLIIVALYAISVVAGIVINVIGIDLF